MAVSEPVTSPARRRAGEKILPVAVAAPNRAAAEAGARAGEAGGNAVDAALAAGFAAMVSEPGVVALGGGAFLTIAPLGEPAVTVDGSVSMPGAGLPPEAFGSGLRHVEMDYGGGTVTEVGHGSVATPGALVAFETAHQRYGRLPWREIVAPAAELARTGFPVGPASGFYLGFALDTVFGHDEAVQRVMRAPDGRQLRAGDWMAMPELGAFLDRVAEEGVAALHAGDVAAALADEMAANGGLVTREDLAAYRAVVRPALTLRSRGWELATNPPPAVGGSVLAAMLLLLDGLLADREPGPWGPADLAAVVEVQRAVLSYRVRHLELAPDRRRAVELMLADIAAAGPAWLRSAPSTVNISVVDGDGQACSITASCGYGAGVSVPGTGIWLNNCLGEHELNRGGVHSLPVGERLLSNMAPTVGRHTRGDVLAVGSPGADRIATAVLQTLAPTVHGGAGLQAAIDAPRVHVTCADDGAPRLVDYEADLDRPAGVAEDLPWRRHDPNSMFFGGVTAAVLQSSGRLEAAADPRREGAVSVFTP